MTDDNAPRYFCHAHKIPTPAGWRMLPNLRPEKHCERCNEVADVTIFVKPLEYPRLNNA